MESRDVCFDDLVREQQVTEKQEWIDACLTFVAEQFFPRNKGVEDVLSQKDHSFTFDYAVAIPDTRIANQALVAEFEEHAAKWKWDTAASSSLVDIAAHPSYLRIIGLGPSVIPLVLRDLKATGDPWFCALRALTGQNPVAEKHRGNFKKMAKDWLVWGSRHGLI